MTVLTTTLANLALAPLDVGNIVNAVVFSALGVVLFGLFWLLVVFVTPFSIRKEIEEDQNISLGIVLGAMLIGMSMIIAAAVGG